MIGLWPLRWNSALSVFCHQTSIIQSALDHMGFVHSEGLSVLNTSTVESGELNHTDLLEEVAVGKFQGSLFHRLIKSS